MISTSECSLKTVSQCSTGRGLYYLRIRLINELIVLSLPLFITLCFLSNYRVLMKSRFV